MSHLLHVFPLISLHKSMLITDAYQWNAHDHFKRIDYEKEHSLGHAQAGLGKPWQQNFFQ